ncbi:hypothetical protein ACVGXD_02310, partial [Enterobacter intestinihominis]
GELSGVSDTQRGEVDYGYVAEGRLLKHYEARQGHSRAQFTYDAAENLAASDDAVPVTDLSLIQISEPTRRNCVSGMPSSG